MAGIHVSPLVLRWGRRRGSVGVAAKSPAGARCRGDRAPPRLRAGGRPSAVGKGRVAAVARALTLRSTLDRWFRILPSTGSFWMKRHLPAPYFFTPLRSASSSSGDHCVRRVDGIGRVSDRKSRETRRKGWGIGDYARTREAGKAGEGAYLGLGDAHDQRSGRATGSGGRAAPHTVEDPDVGEVPRSWQNWLVVPFQRNVGYDRARTTVYYSPFLFRIFPD